MSIEDTSSQTAAAEPAQQAGEPVPVSEAPSAAIPPDVITPPAPSELDIAKARIAAFEAMELTCTTCGTRVKVSE